MSKRLWLDDGLRVRVAELEGVIQTQNGVVVSGTLKLNEARVRVAKLEAALRDIAKQMLSAEMDQQQYRYADYEGAYETMIQVARAALKEAPGG